MAQKVNILLVDDLDGKDADQTISFAFEGIEYTIDLSDKNADKFRSVIAPYLGAAQRVGKTKGAKGKPSVGPSAREIREWAKSNGFEVPERGRIPEEVRAAFDAR